MSQFTLNGRKNDPFNVLYINLHTNKAKYTILSRFIYFFSFPLILFCFNAFLNFLDGGYIATRLMLLIYLTLQIYLY